MMAEHYFDEEAYNRYFGITKEETPKEIKSSIPYPDTDTERGNIGDIDTFAELLRVILNAAFGNGWGEFGPELKKGENPQEIILPQITYDTYNREVTEKMPIKPILTGTVREVIDGKDTGDAFQVYRQWFDVIVEFNVWGRDTLETRKIADALEKILSSYAGYFKKKGISEMFFLKEVSSKQSDKFIEGMPMKPLMYYFKIERIHTIRVSTLDKINYAIKTFEDNKFTTYSMYEASKPVAAADNAVVDESPIDENQAELVPNRVTNSLNIQNKITYDL